MKNPEGLASVSEQMTEDMLAALLESSGIDLDAWGTGDAKTITHLLSEINSGESHISVDANQGIVRRISVAWVGVLYFDEQGNVHQLYEDRQEYTDGRVRKRSLSSSLGEKFLPDEDPAQAAARALSEELGIREYVSLNALGSEQTAHFSDSYPGLKSEYDTHGFVAVVDGDSYSPDGYIEEQGDKTNFYKWKII